MAGGLYQPSPAIPLASKGDRWARVIEATAREAGSLVAKAERNGGRLGKGDASKYLSLITTLEGVKKITPAQSTVAAAALGPLLGELRSSLADMIDSLPGHAEESVADLGRFLGRYGQAKVANRGALAATAARTTQNMTADWTRLAAQTRDGIVEATVRSMGAGLNPTDAARRMQGLVTDVGTLTYARANTIARTEMADLYDAARLGYMAGNPQVHGWMWRARPDACAICQIQHGQVFESTTPPSRHHNCRCIVVPIPASMVEDKDLVVAGEYVEPGVLPGALGDFKRRPRHEIVARLPKSWEANLPLDLRELVTLRQNPGWRPSLTLQRPAGPLRPGKITPPPPPPPAPPAPPTPPVAPPAPPPGEADLATEAQVLRDEFKARDVGVDPEAQSILDRMKTARQKWEAEEDYVGDLDPGPERTKAKRRATALQKEYSKATAEWSEYRASAGLTGAISEKALAQDFDRLRAIGAKARAQSRALVRQGATDAERAAANRGLLDRLRGTGSSSPQPRALKSAKNPQHNTSRYGQASQLDDMATAQVRQAHEVFPTEWLDDADGVLGQTRWSMADRGYNNGGGQYIVVSPSSTAQRGREYVDTAIHELGHTFQKTRRNINRAELAFWRHRSGVLGKPGQYPELVERDKAFVPKAPARPTPEWYTLKTYAFDGKPNEYTSFEVFTTGVQQLLGGNWNYTGRGFGRMTMLDDEFEDWLWGVLLCL